MSTNARTGAAGTELIERDGETEVIAAALAAAAQGRGGVIVIEGAPGVGKSRLLQSARELARDAGARLLGARGSELESAFAFGVVRQLLEGPLAGLDDAGRDRLLSGAAGLAAPLLAERRRRPRPDAPAPSEAGGLHGLYWLVANLAREQRLVMCVDDGQWVDEPSLRWLTYLSRRIGELPITLIVATRPVREGEAAELLSALEQAPETSLLTPGPLSVQGTAAMIEELLGAAAGGEDVAASHRLTSGNPLLLVELLRSLASESLAPTAANVQRLFAAGPDSLSRAALARLRGLPPGAVALTRALAVLERAPLRLAADLAGLDPADAERAAQALVDVGVVADTLPLEFEHPLIRSSVYADLSAARRASAHLQAARLLAATGADPERVAGHLLHAEPCREPWAVQTLETAAATAWARGAPDTALGYLRRAAAELPAAERPVPLLLALGRAEARAGDLDTATESLRQAVATAAGPVVTAATLALATALTVSGRGAEARAPLTAALHALADEDRDRGLALRAALALATLDGGLDGGLDGAGAEPRFTPDLEAPTVAGDHMWLALSALQSALTGDGAQRAVELAQRAQAGGLLLAALDADDPLLVLPAVALIYAGRPNLAIDLLGDVLAHVTRAGSRRAASLAGAWRALASLRAGRPVDAELDALRALEIDAELGAGYGSAVALGVAIEALIERGGLDDADRLAAEHAPLYASGPGLFAAHLSFALGRLHAARERWSDAERALRDCEARHRAAGVQSPAASPWRAQLAFVAAGAGREAEALAIAAKAVELARAGDSASGLGAALRARGAVHPDGRRRLELLREAVSVLRDSEARLELARAIAELGAELRRSGHRREAWTELSEAHRLARECGAAQLDERIRGDLVVLGARPRRGDRLDRDQLTAAEDRVAQLAARGLTNRQIAAELFVTAKTVEYHLTSIYRKLSISSREDLADALGGPALAA